MDNQTTNRPQRQSPRETNFSRGRIALGVLIGVATYLVILIGVWASKTRPGNPVDPRPIAFVIYAAIATPMLAITAAAFAIPRGGRPFGLGLLIGTMVGLIGSMGGCMALL